MGLISNQPLKFCLKGLSNFVNNNYNNQRERSQQKNILITILNAIIVLTGVGVTIISGRLIFNPPDNYQNNSISLFTVIAIFLLFIGLRLLTKKNHPNIAAGILIFILFSLASYMGFIWGVDLPAELLFYVLVIVISGILIGSRFALISTLVVILTLAVTNFLHHQKIIPVTRHWTQDLWGSSDLTISATILFIIALVLWLFNRELDKSKLALKNERDLLELKVEEKTKELRLNQAKEIAQVYRFAEFGKLSSGLFHDLINPLTAIMLNINKVKLDNESNPDFKLISSEINQAIKASDKMRDFINSVRKQINFQEQLEFFSLNKEIEEAITILDYKARKNKIDIFFEAEENLKTNGNPIKFNQIITNLVSNSIDACLENKDSQKIIINLTASNNIAKLEITDFGKGISEENKTKIFAPFFSTKNNQGGLGLGLSLVKQIVEESFLGTIKVSSCLGKGTTFTITIPLCQK